MSASGGKAGENAGRKPRRVGAWMTVIVGALLMLMMFLPAAFILVCIGMAPTVIAALFDGHRGARALPCMAAFNLAGVMAVLAMLTDRGRSISVAMDLSLDSFVWGLMYGGAGVAVFLLWCCPLLVQSWNDTVARRDQKKMEHIREKLIAEWGKQIIKDASQTGPMENPSG